MFGLAHRLLKIDLREVEFARRGFTCAVPEIQDRLENIGRVFLQGYHAALAVRPPAALAAGLEQVELEYRGFAYEGAAMALALLDGIAPGKRRLLSFLRGGGERHVYMVHVGAGWAYARLPWLRRRIERSIHKFDPVLRWLVIDGFGFHQGYFHWPAAAHCAAGFSEQARHVYYQGLGRSLWFVHGADPLRISSTIQSFEPQYHGDAWSGVGIACAYAGGLDPGRIEELRTRSGRFETALAQGAAFAVTARIHAGNPAAHTSAACLFLCGLAPERAAAVCDETLALVDRLQPCPYQQWRELVQQGLLFRRTSEREAQPVLLQ